MKKNILLIPVVVCAVFNLNAQTPETISATSTDTIYSGYGASCFTGGCSYQLSVPIPPYFIITDVMFSFDFRALGTCNLNQGGWDLRYRTCRSPANPNEYQTCTIGIPGLCINQHISCLNDIKSCILPPQCTGYNMDFTLTFYRCVQPGAGCGFSCIIGDSPWTMAVVGYSSPAQVQIKSSQNGDSVCNGSNVLLTAVDSFGVAPYSTATWSPGGMVGNSILVTPTSDTAFVATVTDTCGDTATDTIRFKVMICTGIESYSSNGFTLYPNPANTQLTLYSSFIHSNEVVTISIMNVLGEIMQEEKKKWTNETNINIKSLSAGMYFLQMKTESGSVVKRFVKEE